MKKFLIASLILFAINIGCKKMNPGETLCGCSPVKSPELVLTIKNTAGEDLLSDQVTGAYTKEKISVVMKDKDGKEVQLPFAIRPPFSYGDQKFETHILNISIRAVEPVFLKLGDDRVYKLNFTFDTKLGRVDQLTIDDKSAEKAEGEITKFMNVFYLTVAPPVGSIF